MSFKCEAGEVCYSICTMPGCCGIAIIKDVIFYPKSAEVKFKLYDEFLKFIKDQRHPQKKVNRWGGGRHIPDQWKLYKYLMTDRVFDKAKSNTIQEFCEYTGWLGGTKTKNTNYTDHDIQCWEFDIKGTVK